VLARRTAAVLVPGVFLIPAVHLAALSITRDGGLSLAAYREAFDPRFLPVLGRTALLAAGAALIATALGGLAAAVFERREFPCRRLFRAAALAPLLLPPVFQVAVWERLAVPGGILASLFGAPEEKPFPIRNPAWAAFLLGLGYSPLLFFFASQGLRAVPRELVEAARLAHGPAAVWARVIAPLGAPFLLAGSAIAFTLSFLNYEVPRLLEVPTYPVLVQASYGAVDDPGLAFAFASPGLALAAAAVALAGTWAGRKGFALTGRESPEALGPEGRPGVAAWSILAGWWGLTAILPLAVLVRLAGPLATYRLALSTDGEKVLSSLATAASAGVLAAAIAGVSLLGGGRRPGRLAFLVWIALALPGSLLAFALTRTFRHGPLVAVHDSWAMAAIAGTFRFFPLAYFALAAHLRSVPDEEWEAAALGRSWAARWFRAGLPLAAPGLAAGAVAVALFTASELPATLLLAAPGREPLLVRIYNLLHYDPERDLLAALSIFHVASAALVAGAFLAAGRALRR
jgi:iron(III) transport system permease protein